MAAAQAAVRKRRSIGKSFPVNARVAGMRMRPGDLGMSCSTPGTPVRCDRDQFILKYLTFG
ncbi:hypothetical protein GCM10007921_35720 [Tritonibacter mobilis]|nr:hypothetical protein GCM10007921_35720 [Tritonibacter mobilis]